MGESEFLFASKMYSNATFEVLSRDLINWYFQYQSIIWTAVLLTPIIVTFILPVVMLALVYISALYLKAYRYYYKINGYTFTPKCWEPARSILAYLWDAQARFWYGYEIEGLENIPDDGPALIVFYHGAMPVDWYYLLAKTIIHKNRLICAVGDRFLFSIPAFDALIDCFHIYPGTIDTCADILRKGNLLAIAPGGVREALFGDETYPLIWGTRIGFAKVAMEAKVHTYIFSDCTRHLKIIHSMSLKLDITTHKGLQHIIGTIIEKPIVPVFTENIREAFFTLRFAKNWLRSVYERTRIPLVPIYGGFPVKLRTIVGQPVEYDPDITPEEMASRVAERMKSMIKQHQQLPGSVTRSVIQRVRHLFTAKPKCA